MTIGPFESGELTAQQLLAEGIDTAFGIVAAPIIPVIQGIAAAGIKMVGARHEQQATFMAQAWGYLRGKPGIVVVGSGPAMTNTLTSLYVARENGWPVVVIAGAAPSHERSLGTFQELDQRELAAPLCKWTATVGDVSRFPELLRMAVARATHGRPGPVYLEVPAQVATESSRAPVADIRGHLAPARAVPEAAAIRRAGELIASAQRPLLVFNEEAAWARAEKPLSALADLGVPFIASPMGRGVVADSHPAHVGAARGHALRQADLVLAVGAKFDWMLGGFDRLAENGNNRRLIQVSLSRDSFYRAADLDLMLCADPAATVELLVAELAGRSLPSKQWDLWRGALRERDAANRERSAKQIADNREKPYLTQSTMFAVLNESIAANDIIVTDGEVTPGAGRLFLKADAPRRRLDPGPTGCMGIGVPFAIGAALAEPESRVFAILGDYAFGASAMEVETAVRVGADVIFVIANNAGIVGSDLQQAVFEESRQPVATLLPAAYEHLAHMVDTFGVSVTDAPQLRAAMSQALARRGVSIINVILHSTDHGVARGNDYLTGGYTMRANPHRSHS